MSNEEKNKPKDILEIEINRLSNQIDNQIQGNFLEFMGEGAGVGNVLDDIKFATTPEQEDLFLKNLNFAFQKIKDDFELKNAVSIVEFGKFFDKFILNEKTFVDMLNTKRQKDLFLLMQDFRLDQILSSREKDHILREELNNLVLVLKVKLIEQLILSFTDIEKNFFENIDILDLSKLPQNIKSKIDNFKSQNNLKPLHPLVRAILNSHNPFLDLRIQKVVKEVFGKYREYFFENKHKKT